MFLTPDELADLTDYKRSACQARWLSDRGIPFATGRSGRPKVLRSIIMERLGGTLTPVPIGPDIMALETELQRRGAA